MSSNQSYSYTSTSYSTSSSTDPEGKTKTYTEKVYSSDRDGTHIERTNAETGKPTTIERSSHPAERQVQDNSAGRIEDATDADREYLERMEDEYAKREGGA